MDLLVLDESVEASLRLYDDIDEAEGSGDTPDIWPHSADGLMGDAVEFGLLIASWMRRSVSPGTDYSSSGSSLVLCP